MRSTEKVNQSVSPVFFAVAVLLCLTLVSGCLTSGIYARYATRDTSRDSATVAAFKVSDIIERNGITLDWRTGTQMKPGDTVTYSFRVQNDSEVVIRYSVTADNSLTGNLPLSITSPEGVLDIGETKTLSCVISWPAEKNDPALCGMADLIEFHIRAVQAA